MTNQPNYVKLNRVPLDLGQFITPDMVLAKEGCRKCHGRGHQGHTLTDNYNPVLKKTIGKGTALPCSCLVVDIDKLRHSIEKAKADLEAHRAAEPSTEPLEAIHEP